MEKSDMERLDVHIKTEPDVKEEVLQDAAAESYAQNVNDKSCVDNSCEYKMDLDDKMRIDIKPESCDINEENCIEIKPLDSLELIPIEVKFEGQGSEIHLWKRYDSNLPDVDVQKDTPEKCSSDNEVEMHEPQGSIVTPKDELYTCSLCSMKFQQQRHLAQHMQSSLNTCSPSHNGKAYNVCGKEEVGDLEKQIKIHSGEKLYTCEKPIETHSVGRSYTCDKCGQGFVKHNNLVTHMKKHRERSNTCNICGRGFTHLGRLKQHLRVHTKERPKKMSVEKNFHIKIT